MDKYEYLVKRVNARKAEYASERLNELGAEGWDVRFGTSKDNDIILVLQRPIQSLRQAVKKAEAKKAEEDKKKVAQDRMAKARAAKKAKAEAKKSEGA